MSKKLEVHTFVFNEEDNSGESLSLLTKVLDNGDKDENSSYLNQTITLNSYGNSVSLNLSGIQITPEKLRDLADQLEKFINNEKNKILTKT